MVVFLQLNLRSVAQIAIFPYLYPGRSNSKLGPRARVRSPAAEHVAQALSINAGSEGGIAVKPSICTADELHYVPVPNSFWRLALWRYTPSPEGPKRNHPLLLLSGVGTNAVGYDLAPGSSFARYMSNQGFDTWILEVRGAGLSMDDGLREAKHPANTASVIKHANACSTESPANINSHAFAKSEIALAKEQRTEGVDKSDDLQLRAKFTVPLMSISDGLSRLLNEGLLPARLNSALASQVQDWSQKLANTLEEGQRSVGLQEGFFPPLSDIQKQLGVLAKYNWDFDNYLEEDVPAAIEYIRNQCKPKDNKLLAIGHSMGGILLYALLSRNGYIGRDSELVSVVTLGSSLDYTTSRSSLRLLLPLVDAAQAMNVPAIPLGALLAAAYPLAARPPYFLSWLNSQISAQNMMHPDMFERLVLNNFCTIPATLLLQLRTVFQEGGLCDRSKTFFYKDHLCKSKVPVLALAGDQDMICPPEAVYETVKLIPEHSVTFQVFGEPSGPHYAHYDLVGGSLASDQVYPCIVKHLLRHDQT